MMSTLGPMDNSLQTRFALQQASTFSLEHKLKNRENREDLMKTARQFEGVFVKQLLDQMDKTIDRSDFMGGGSAEETFRGMMYERIAENIASRPGGSGFGIAEAIYRQMEQQLPKESTDASDANNAKGVK